MSPEEAEAVLLGYGKRNHADNLTPKINQMKKAKLKALRVISRAAVVEDELAHRTGVSMLLFFLGSSG